MNTLNLKAAMKTPDHLGAGTSQSLVPTSFGFTRPASWLILLVGLVWLNLPYRALSQLANYADESAVAAYVKQMLYWTNAPPTEQQMAAFRYKHLLYTNDAGIRPQQKSMTNFYGPRERVKSQAAEAELQHGLAIHPVNTLLGDLLLDIYYDRTVAETILAREAVEKAERAHFGSPIAFPAPAGGFIIDNEIQAYTNALPLNQAALTTYFALFTNQLGVADGNPTPLGFRIFQARVPARGLDPASYLSNGVPVSVLADPNPLFGGYRDLVLLYEVLNDYGRTAATLARLRFLRNGAGDAIAANSLVTEAERTLVLHSQFLQTAFPTLDANDSALARSGLAAAIEGVSDSLAELEGLKQLQRSQLNPLGFETNFLVLVQSSFAGEARQSNTFDAFLVHLANPNSVLGLASAALGSARTSYDKYSGLQDQLADQFTSSSITYSDRLRDIVGYFPDDPAYATNSQGASGSELDQQNLSIEAARLQIRRNQAEIDNLQKQAEYELSKAVAISNVYVTYGDKQATLTEAIGIINGVQAAANEFADAAESANSLHFGGAAAHAGNAVIQYAAEFGKGLLEAQKERQAAMQSAEITGIEARTTVKILLLQMNTLAIDSLSAALQLRKDINRLQDLYREKAQLERNLRERDQNMTSRYFADPVHRLTLQSNMIEADLAFTEAQKWLFFMARALEYKWNEPLTNMLNGGKMADLFKLRNADELQQMYTIMKHFDDEHVLSVSLDDRFDWFSVREHFLGFTRNNDRGQPAFYVNPVTGQTNDAIGAFRLHLNRLVVNGWIELEFSTVRELENKSFFRGPTYKPNGDVDSTKPGFYLDKIHWLKIRLPGSHAQEPVSGYLRYGGTSYIRNPQFGTRDPLHPDRIRGEMTAYSTRHWMKVDGQWVFTDGINEGISMLKVPRTESRLDGNPNNKDVLPSVNEIDVFSERSVAATRWHLAIPVTGSGSVSISDLDDIEIYFYHWSCTRSGR
jgi:hypothetical protein